MSPQTPQTGARSPTARTGDLRGLSISAPKKSWRERVLQSCDHILVLTLDELRRLPQAKPGQAGVYFLWHEDELQYVGQSIDVSARLNAHHLNRRYGTGGIRNRAANAIQHNSHTCLVLALDRPTAHLIKPKLREYESLYIATYVPPKNVESRKARL